MLGVNGLQIRNARERIGIISCAFQSLLTKVAKHLTHPVSQCILISQKTFYDPTEDSLAFSKLAYECPRGAEFVDTPTETVPILYSHCEWNTNWTLQELPECKSKLSHSQTPGEG